MAKVKYRVREYTPTGNMPGTHSFYAEAVVDNEINNQELAAKVAARTGVKSYEAAMVIAAVADIIAEETLENNRVCLNNGDGVHLVSIYPKVTGRISDKEVVAAPDKYDGKTVAEAAMLTPDRLQWTLGATVGIKYSRQFALNKEALKVDYNPAQTPAEPDDTTGTTTPTTPGSGDDPNSGND